MKKSIREIYNYYAGRPIAILGAGPSLPDDLARLPEHTILISVNQHALILTNPQFLVFCDEPRQERLINLRRGILSYKARELGHLISPIEFWTDFILDTPYWDGGFSSALATWLASYLGGDPVLLCGMNCYQDKEKYFYHNPDIPYHPCYDFPLQNHLKAWRPAHDLCPNSKNIKAVSGPLVEIFGRY